MTRSAIACVGLLCLLATVCPAQSTTAPAANATGPSDRSGAEYHQERIGELEADEKQAGQPEKDPGDDTRSIFDDYPELRGDDEAADGDFSAQDKPDDSRPAADEEEGTPGENDR